MIAGGSCSQQHRDALALAAERRTASRGVNGDSWPKQMFPAIPFAARPRTGSEPIMSRRRALASLSVIVLGFAHGCATPGGPDGRKYFHHDDPIEAVRAFCYSARTLADNAGFLSDCLWVEDGDSITVEECEGLASSIDLRERANAVSVLSPDASSAVVKWPRRTELESAAERSDSESARSASPKWIEVELRSETKLVGYTVWLVDVRKTLERAAVDFAARGVDSR
jgi:hypothetical protein